jgi:hypothetical protein
MASQGLLVELNSTNEADASPEASFADTGFALLKNNRTKRKTGSFSPLSLLA